MPLKPLGQNADRRNARYSPVVWGRVNMSPEGTAIPGRVGPLSCSQPKSRCSCPPGVQPLRPAHRRKAERHSTIPASTAMTIAALQAERRIGLRRAAASCHCEAMPPSRTPTRRPDSFGEQSRSRRALHSTNQPVQSQYCKANSPSVRTSPEVNAAAASRAAGIATSVSAAAPNCATTVSPAA